MIASRSLSGPLPPPFAATVCSMPLRPRAQASDSVTDMQVTSWMFFSAIVTPRLSGLRRAPWQTPQGRCVM